MIKFYKEYKKINFNQNLLYINKELSFDYVPVINGDFSIMIGKGYNSLEVCIDTLEVKAVTGLNPYYNWINKKMSKPSYNTGILKVEIEDIDKGIGTQYINSWETYYDKTTGWICMTNNLRYSVYDGVEFAKNTVAVLKDRELVALWLKPILIK